MIKCSRWPALPQTLGFACAWTRGRDGLNSDTWLAQSTDGPSTPYHQDLLRL
jgi:hypothetical protein